MAIIVRINYYPFITLKTKLEPNNYIEPNTVEPRFNEVTGDRPNLFVKWRVRYIENLDITNLREKDQNVRYIEVLVYTHSVILVF